MLKFNTDSKNLYCTGGYLFRNFVSRSFRQKIKLFLSISTIFFGVIINPIYAHKPSAFTHAVQPLEFVERVITEPIDLQAVQLEDEQRELEGAPFRFAIPRATLTTAITAGTWEEIADSTLMWRLRISSPGAYSLNLGFTRYHMPPGGIMFVYSADGKQVLGPFTNHHNEEHGQLWTPVVLSDEIVVEVTIPSVSVPQLELELTAINHGYRGFGQLELEKSGWCNIDVVCPEGDPWRDQIRSVALYSVGGEHCCTGALVNNTAEDDTPYFLTANHCDINSTNAASMVVYWNYERPYCGSGSGSLIQYQSGAYFRATYTTSDFTLVELDDDPEPSFNVYFAGWDRSDAAPGSAVAIHHPNCEEKSISFENDPLKITSYLTIANYEAPFNGIYPPEGYLDVLNGKSITGTWELEITDDAASDQGTLDSWSLIIRKTSSSNYVVYPSLDVPKEIPDPGTVDSTLLISESGNISDLNVKLNITHSWDADLDVFLIAPDGTRVELFTDVGGEGDNFTNTILDDEGDRTHLRVTDWDAGTTEHGSSGCPLFDPNKRIVGQLHGGYAACDNDEPDWFGRFYTSWTGGGTNSTRLSNWLDPIGTGTLTLDGKNQSPLCSITVTDPPDGGWWELGDVLPITWDSEGTSGDVKIELYKGGSFVLDINESCHDTGSYDWPIPTDGNLIGDDDYQIKVTDVWNLSCTDLSKCCFGIATPPVAQDSTVNTSTDTPIMITLQASDEGQPDPPGALKYIITSLPIYGDLNDPFAGPITIPDTNLVNYGNKVEYVPDIGYEVQDSFTFIANDDDNSPGGGYSNEATVFINVRGCTFFDDFPSIILNADNWPDTSGTPTVDILAVNEPSPPYSLHLEATDSVTSRIVDLYGCWSAQLHYSWKRVSTEPNDDLYMDYWDGNEWQTLDFLPDGTDTVWEPNSVELPAGALHPEFRLRLRADCDSSSDEWYIDDVCIQCQLCIEPPNLQNEPDTTQLCCNTIYWEPVDEANEYYAECSSDPCFYTIDANSGWIMDTSYEFCGLTPGQRYWYHVSAWAPFLLKNWLQTTQADFETDTPTNTIADANGNVVLVAEGGTTAVDTVGSKETAIATNSDSYLNGFHVITKVDLTKIEIYLDISTSRKIEFVVYEANEVFHTDYKRIYHSSTPVDSGTGTGFYASGQISVSLKADKHYLIGAVWDGNVTTYYDSSDSSTSFADHKGWALCSEFPSPDIIIDSNVNVSNNTFYHRYTTTQPFSGYVSPGSIVSAAIDLPVDGNWGVVDFDTTIPVDTELTVDILPGVGSTPIYENVPSGTDLSGIGDLKIRLQANLSTTDANNTPVLHNWSVSYTDPALACESDWSNVESSLQYYVTPGDFDPDCDVDVEDLAVFVGQWLLQKLPADVAPDGGDGIVNFLDWADFASGWQNTTDINDLAAFADQWLQLGAYNADIAPPPDGDGIVNFLDFALFAQHWLEGYQ